MENSPMATKIIHKKSSTASSVPAAGVLEPGELAINLADAKLYTETTGGAVIEIAADQTGAEIKAAYQAEANAFTDALFTKLAGIETAATADQTGAQIKALYEAETNAFTDTLKSKLDAIEASATADQTGAQIKALYEAEANAFTDTLKTKLDAIEASATADQTGAEIKALYEAETSAFTDALFTKLNAIEALADVTDTTNVVAALTAGSNVAIAADGTISATDTNTTYSVGDGGLTTNDFTNADHSKLNAIEASATADQTGSEIKALYEAEANAFTDAQFTKLAGIETSATADQSKSDIEGLGIELPAANLTGTIAAARLDTATTQSAANNSTKIATTAYVETAVAAVVDTAPAALNTLNELAAALGDDVNFATTTATSLGEKLPKAGGEMTGNITMSGSQTVDGRDLSVDGTKLDSIEVSATADQTDAEIRAAVEAATDSNVFTDADHTKLNGIAASANAYVHPNHSGEVTSAADGATVIADNVVDEANLKVSNSPTNGYFLSAQSGNTGGLTWAEISASDDTKLPLTGGTLTGDLTITDTTDDSAAGPELSLARNSTSPADGDYLGQLRFDGKSDTGTSRVYAKMTGKTSDVSNGAEDGLIETAVMKNGTQTIVARQTHDALKLINGTGLEVAGNITVTGTVDGRDVATDGTKLDGIEASADVTDATNVTAAGALMDSEVTNLAQVKSFDSSDYATAAQGTTADAAMPKSGGAFTGAVTTNSTIDGVDIATRDGVLTSTTTTANAALPKAGGAMTGNLTHGDSVKAMFGASDDLQIYHDGSNSVIADTGTGALILYASDFVFQQNGSNERMADMAQNGAVRLYYDNAVKLATTSTGLSVTGAITTNSTFDGRDVATDGTKLDGIATSANNYVHPNHSGEVTSTADGGTVIASNVVDEDNLKVSNSPTNGYMLTAQSGNTGGLTWAAAPTDTNTTYTAGGDYGMTLSGTEFRLEDDRRRNSSSTDIYSGNTHDYTHYDADVGIRWYTANAEDMRLTDAGDLHVDGNITAYSATVSDERLKTDIKPIENALDMLDHIGGYTFNYIKDNKASAGVIAQEVEKVLPSAVKDIDGVFHGSHHETHKTVEYDQLIGVLIAAVKELKAEVKELKNHTH
jgi:hypothetical protein